MIPISKDSILNVVLSYNIVDSNRCYSDSTDFAAISIDDSGKSRFLPKLITTKFKCGRYTYNVRIKMRKVKSNVLSVSIYYVLRGTTVPSCGTLSNTKIEILADNTKIYEKCLSSEIFSNRIIHLVDLVKDGNVWQLVPLYKVCTDKTINY